MVGSAKYLCYSTAMAVVASLTMDAANILKVIIQSTTGSMDRETADVLCQDIMFCLICDNQLTLLSLIIGCRPLSISSAARFGANCNSAAVFLVRCPS